ncbi:MAG: hypothetical protein FWF22_05780 [Treponema sp.]|nr:hypothetical protein [Treponema sp.]
MKKIKLLLCVFLVLPACQAVWSADFGLLLDQSAGFGGYGSSPDFDYTGMLIPRLSSPIGSSGFFYASAGMRAEYSNGFILLPELLRTEFSWQFDNSTLTAGRMYYSDPLGFAAEGLFDGVSYSADTAIGTLSAGAWYTGFQYKKRANIAMDENEQKALTVNTDYNDFINTYFAPRRVLAALDWYNANLADLFGLNLSLLGQFDLNDPGNFSDGIHTQYLIGKATIPFYSFVLNMGACFELAQISGSLNYALAGELGAAFDLPTAIDDQLTVLARYSSGNWDNSSLIAFLPVTNQNQGQLLKPRFSGISLISLDYLARLNSTMSAEGSSVYYIRNDLGTFNDYGSAGYFLGNEFFARFYWSPVSDLQLNAGAGIFLPGLGNAAPAADPLWRMELNLVLSLY